MHPSSTIRFQVLVVALTATLGACGRSEARDADPYAARMAQTPPPYDRAAHRTAAPATSTPADSAPPRFTTNQAARGAEVYRSTCARCHAATQWQGGTFAAGWQGRRLSDFFDLVSTTMPQDAPGTLTQRQYVDVTAYVLKLAGYAGGDVALTPDTAVMRHARLAIRTAPDTTTTR